QHQDGGGVTRVVHGAQRRRTRAFPRLLPPRLLLALGLLALEVLDPAHLDEPVQRPEPQRTDNQQDDRHVRRPPRTPECIRGLVMAPLRNVGGISCHHPPIGCARGLATRAGPVSWPRHCDIWESRAPSPPRPRRPCSTACRTRIRT